MTYWQSTRFFQALKLFCQSTEGVIFDSLRRFYSKEYAASSVTPEELFQPQLQLMMEELISSTTNDFLLSLQIIRDTTQANGLVSALQTNYAFLFLPNEKFSIITAIIYSDCNCAGSAGCREQFTIYQNMSLNIPFYVPGLYRGCYVLESLLQSTLECLYNQTCLNILQSYITNSLVLNVKALDASLLLSSDKFNINSTIEELIRQLIVDKWHLFSVYENYYEECHPTNCIYTYVIKNDVVHIITIVFGLIGGLITILKLIIPRLVKLIRRFRQLETEIIISEPNVSLFSKAKNYLITLNIFSATPPSDNEFNLQSERISTRLFLILFILLTSILIGYTSLVNITKTTNIPTPTLSQYSYLYSKYSSTLTYPCKKISIKYDKFLRVNYTLHQVCSSIFVTNEWIGYLAGYINEKVWNSADFRVVGTYMFQALKSFCQSSEGTIINSLIRFYSREYTTLSVTSEEFFQTQTQLLIDEFIFSTIKDFALSLQIIHNTTQVNGLYAAMRYQYVFYENNQSHSILSGLNERDGCYCTSLVMCIQQIAIYDDSTVTPLFNVSHLYTGCFVIAGLLKSTLECFYNQTCLNILQSYLISSSSMNLSALDSSSLLLSEEFYMNSTIENLINQLMVQKWNLSSIYENYYDECQPFKCSYIHVAKNDIIYIITVVFGLIGGLIRVLKLIIPRLVKLIRTCLRFPRLETVNNINEPTVGLCQKAIDFIRKLNLFPSIPPPNDEFNLRNERISTRLFLIILILTMTIILSYTSLINVTKTNTINVPTLKEYSHFYSKYSQVLICPCKEISIKYETFLQVNYTIHQICQSLFVTDSFIEYYFPVILHETLYYRDFRITGSYTFNALISLCHLMKKILADNLIEFYSSQYIGGIVTSEQLFHIQIQLSFEQFISSTINHLLLSMQIIRDTTQANTLLSGRMTNYDFQVTSIPELPQLKLQQPIPQYFPNCSCAISVSCLEQTAIYNISSNQIQRFRIPGMYTGCFIIEALLQSTLECFYNQTCLNIVLLSIRNSSSMNITALHSSLLDRHRENSTIQELVNDLMVENWNLSIIYKNYYDQCQPIQCSYTYVTRNDVIYITTTIFSLIGGLITVLKLLIPRLIRFIARFICKYTQRIVPSMPIVQN